MSRLITSVVVAAQAAGKAGCAERAVWACLRAYREHLTELTSTAVLDAWNDVTRVERLLDAFTEPDWRERAAARIDRRSRRRTSRGALEHLTEVVRGRPQIAENGPFRVHLDEDERGHALRAFVGYRQSLDEHLQQPAAPARPV